MKWQWAAIIMVLAGFWATAGLAQTDGKVEVTADKFTVDENAQNATFEGNAVIRRPDMVVYANKVVVRYGPGGPSDLKEFVATGNVKIEQPDQTAKAERGVYDPKTKILKLTGNVSVTSASGTVTGPELLVNLTTGVSEFSAQKGGRVTGIFSTEGAGQ